MNTSTLPLHQLSKAKTAATKAPVSKQKSETKPKKEHWTVQFFKHVDALGDELRKEGKVL